MLTANTIAKFFIYMNNQDKKGLTNKKLQKLLYYSQAWSLVINNRPLFSEDIQAWIHGPAIQSVYRTYATYKAGDITENVVRADFADIDSKDEDLLKSVWNIYGKYDGNYLEALSHSEKPWQEARKGLEIYEPSTNTITLDSMKVFYGQKLKETQKERKKN